MGNDLCVFKHTESTPHKTPGTPSISPLQARRGITGFEMEAEEGAASLEQPTPLHVRQALSPISAALPALRSAVETTPRGTNRE
ncbi:hypothetical protein SKAU_G00084330 [Synaphobranchus kaupii]|uniref:Uncharacterized protein n=1 Tax=Synaphobranchus kaupii TaxID=118154 RepID=A0A9Q1FVF7_SYNKA|nr:hypothetical protein SKAU_G00084330 [Synaphobranchus kaupii]